MRVLGQLGNKNCGAAYNTPHKGGRKAKVPRQVTHGRKRPQRATGRK